MAYTAPATFSAGQLVTATDLNTQVRDNLIALKDPNSAHYELNESVDYTTTSTAFVNIDATAGKLSLSITLAVVADVFIFFTGAVENSGGNRINFDVTMDGTRIAGDDGLMVMTVGVALATPVYFTLMKTAVSAAAHTFNLQWKTSAGTATMYAGAGTSNQRDIHPQFIVREMS
jgi:hypothetical protein